MQLGWNERVGDVVQMELRTGQRVGLLPDADLEHAAEQLGVVGDDPADVDDELLLQHGLSLAVRTALPVNDVLNDSRRQRVRDHLLLVSKKTQSHLVQRRQQNS